ncbi:tRNA (N6-threonylcarbamoyladenosine(37)-N6)-methyltransferase TrmO [Fulvimarina sp. 2208YS6-2-32]|uniref:tRNA (N6-threonylcarbamoyladenosine(37)-N6)-methyltransferase TrmO n=1 Tax=Fulvimarina uroteuthidis TaxID=3098149 RepID=A0ABU5I5G9_9HYPH|nr:tRNA (N6-threonylcarbamoyladenosine(37)-N6)-methyltransferase TrmO [Fulvimarina sp. 2208YS6-2-32]MDY8109973.1 tRNA (N6-threonylcarbamoyladenosine(37)-N6)-methyltransferase TrmO [Fulvimarina sp. 2208YS6-2-32]
MTDPSTIRHGEVRFSAIDDSPFDAGVRFIGRIRSPWKTRADCPKNMARARERDQLAHAELFAPYGEALAGLTPGSHVFLLSFLDRSARDLALQMPRHADAPRGTFSLRSPVRPNPIGLHLVKLVAIDRDAGRLTLDAIDVLDDTPLIDIKPYLFSVDAPPQAIA